MKSEGDKVTRLMLMVLIVVTISTLANVSTTAALQVGFYHSTCPHAEAIVRKVVKKAVRRDPSLGAGLLRLHFHDCFVRGCDASVLLDSTQNNKAEKDHPANNPSLRGFDVIDKAKHWVESQCPQTVSCADIVAFAARDSAAVLGGINYGVPAGRRDGRVSLFDDPTRNLPSFLADAEELEKNFGRKGLSLDEMVTLSGAHSVGRSHCSSFTNRLYSSNSSTQLLEDPSLEAELGNKLRQMCPRKTSVDPTAPLDFRTPNSAPLSQLHRRQQCLLLHHWQLHRECPIIWQLNNRRRVHFLFSFTEFTSYSPKPKVQSPPQPLPFKDYYNPPPKLTSPVRAPPQSPNTFEKTPQIMPMSPLKPPKPAQTMSDSDSEPKIPIDHKIMVVQERTGRSRGLDNEYYVNLMKGRGVLTSDQTLADSHLTARIVRYNANYGGVWAKKFAAAMVKMGSIEVLTGEEGEIRKSCRVIN
nr:peroxidase 5-like [Ipomoea batatas]